MDLSRKIVWTRQAERIGIPKHPNREILTRMSGKDPEMAEDTQRQLLKRGHRHPKCVSIAVRHNSKVPVLYVPPAKTALAIARGLLFFEIMDRKVSR